MSWDSIECIERNGIITDYAVVFQEQDGALISGQVNVMDRSFTASGLTPFALYTFEVAGVNDVNRGPFTFPTTIVAQGMFFHDPPLIIIISSY